MRCISLLECLHVPARFVRCVVTLSTRTVQGENQPFLSCAYHDFTCACLGESVGCSDMLSVRSEIRFRAKTCCPVCDESVRLSLYSVLTCRVCNAESGGREEAAPTYAGWLCACNRTRATGFQRGHKQAGRLSRRREDGGLRVQRYSWAWTEGWRRACSFCSSD